jgi:cell division protein FtsZ
MNVSEIKIIGVGATGNQVLERIPSGSINNTDCIVCDVDEQELAKSSVQHKVLIEAGMIESRPMQNIIEKGMDSVLNSELNVAMNAAINNFDQLDSLFDESSKAAILIARLGNTCEAGITPVLAQIAKKRGLFVGAIVYTPFDFEGELTKRIANIGLKKLHNDCDVVLKIKHSKIQKLYGNLGFKSSFGKADDIIIRLAKILLPMGFVNNYSLDLNLFINKHQESTPFFIGIGEGNGNTKAKNAIELALKSTLSERDVFEEVSEVLLQINHGNIEISTIEIQEMKDFIFSILKKTCPIAILLSVDNSIEDGLSVIVIAY